MSPANRWPRRALLPVLILGVLAGAVYLVLAAAPPSPSRENMWLDERRVTVEYTPSAQADDLKLPFYPEASVESSLCYSVKTTDGVPVTFYGYAALHASDDAEKVAEFYSAQLPGNPEPEAIEDGSGRRYVLAIADDNEVRRAIIVQQDEGSRIELTRATRPVIPTPAPRPRTRRETPV